MTKPLLQADVSQLVAAWESAHADLLDLVRDLDHRQWETPTECPGWTIADVVAHVVSLEAVILGDPLPEHTPDWERLPHVTNDFGRLTEVGVDVRRGLATQALVAEFDDVIARRTVELREGPQELAAEVNGPFGPGPIERVLRMRTFDTWVHEQDIRRALGRPGGLDTLGATVTAAQLLQAFPFLWGKKAAAPVGGVLRLGVDGPGITGSWRIVINDEGRAVLSDSMDEPDVMLTCSWPDLVAVMCGRIDPAQAESLSVVALPDFVKVADSLVTALAITP